jgi:hypothetical protein
MTRLANAWRALDAEQRLAALAALALLVTMFFPWYGLQSLNRKSGAIYSHSISAFGDVSFVEAAIFLVAAGVAAMVLARAEGREFQLPGGDGTVVLVAGAWAALLIFYRVFSRPAGDGYPVGIEWGFFLAFVAAGFLAYAGWRIRGSERPEPPLRRARAPRTPSPGESHELPRRAAADPERPVRRPRAEDPDRTVAHSRPAADSPAAAQHPDAAEHPGAAQHPGAAEHPPEAESHATTPSPPRRAAPVAARERFPPAPPEQLSFDEQSSSRSRREPPAPRDPERGRRD